MNLTPIDPRTTISASITEAEHKKSKTQKLESLRQSTREFEAIYINEMFKSMRKTIPEGGLVEKGMSEDIFKEMMDMEIARNASSGEGIGLGKAMYEQLKDLVENKLDR